MTAVPGESGPEAGARSAAAPSGPHGLHVVELVGSHLHVRGHLALGRFPRLADLVNHDRGFIVLHDATILDGDGAETDVELPELVVNQDEVTFIGHDVAGDAGRGAEARGRVGADAPHPAGGPGATSRCVVYTPGHTLSGNIHRFRDISLANFVAATDPRFIEVTDACVRSQRAGARAKRYARLMVNRTQITAIAELPAGARDPAAAGA